MFDRPTVIVLGAGASAPLGFPLAMPLYESVRTGIEGVRKRVNQTGDHLRRIGANNTSQFESNRYEALASFLATPQLVADLLPENFRYRDAPARSLFEFATDLGRSTHDSIDRFIRDNPSHQFAGKALLCANILPSMYRKENHHDSWSLRTFSERVVGTRRNWIHKLVNLLIEGCSGDDLIKKTN